MKTAIQTTRFGEVEITNEHLLTFRDGMIGFPHLKQYVLVESSTMPLLLWLQSIENPAVAFPVVEPWFFQKDYHPSPAEAERVCLDLAAQDRTKIFVVVTIPENMSRMTVNLKAPVVINLTKGTAVQMVLADKAYEVRVPAYDTFSMAVASYNLSRKTADQDIVKGKTEADTWSAVRMKGSRGESSFSGQA